MTIGTAALPDAVQALIDARLDTLDRMLLGRVPRADRRAIVDEVESQIFELLQGHDHGDLSRDDVLGVLARLDPPEAYLPDPDTDAVSPAPRARREPASSPTKRGPDEARVSAAFGLISVGLMVTIPMIYLLAGELESEIIFFGGGAVVCFGMGVFSVLGLVFAYRSRLGSPWAVCGLVTSVVSLLIASLTVLYSFFLIVAS